METRDASNVERAIKVVRNLLARHGVHGEPSILADRSNLVLGFANSNVVARVALATSASRVGIAWLQREVELSRYLGDDLTTVPSEEVPAGPFEIDGLFVSFWRREARASAAPSYASVGQCLSTVHQKLRDYPHARLLHWGAWQEAHAVRAQIAKSTYVSSDDLACIEHAFLRGDDIVANAAARSRSVQAIHGDAHLDNVLHVVRGASTNTLWIDWEDAFVGPIEYDLACLLSKAELFGEKREEIHASLAAYTMNYNDELLRDLLWVRNAQVVVWLALFAERQPELLPRMRLRLAHLR